VQIITTFARRLHEARKRKGLSQRRLGIDAGFDESGASARMNQYERGRHTPDFKTVQKLCSVLEVPPAYMYCEDDDLARVIAGYSSLSKSEKSMVHEIINRTVKF
jgi:transcriptional regulator with XRE-family HTH domain